VNVVGTLIESIIPLKSPVPHQHQVEIRNQHKQLPLQNQRQPPQQPQKQPLLRLLLLPQQQRKLQQLQQPRQPPQQPQPPLEPRKQRQQQEQRRLNLKRLKNIIKIKTETREKQTRAKAVERVTTSVLIQKTNSMLQLMSPLIVPQRVSGGKIIRVNSTAIMEKDQLFQK
jgi:hypothetical protein